jgi:hypothetical protein
MLLTEAEDAPLEAIGERDRIAAAAAAAAATKWLVGATVLYPGDQAGVGS